MQTKRVSNEMLKNIKGYETRELMFLHMIH